jgi:ribulose-phosphate 3-epimerase
MKSEIIPTILVKTFDEVKEKIRLVENYVDWVQLDIMDGVFVENVTWDNHEDLKNFKTKVKLEAHLMVDKPEKIIDDWLKVVDRTIIHQESTKNIQEIIEKTHKQGKEIGIALNPETHPTVIEQFLNNIDLILLMSVQPGKGGQELKEWTLEKADFLKRQGFKGNIEIDGGIDETNIKEAVKHGINLFCVGTGIYQNNDIKLIIEKLKQNVT